MAYRLRYLLLRSLDWLFRKRAQSIGIYYNKSTRKIMRVRVPDYEDEITQPMSGDGLLIVPIDFCSFGRPSIKTLDVFCKKAEELIP